MAFRPKYGRLGLISLPYFLLVELLAPIIEVVGLLGLGAGLALDTVDWLFALLYFLVAYGFGILLSLFPRYERVRDRLTLVPWAALESLGFRQLTAYWRLRGLVKFLRGRTDWGAMTRSGFTVAEDPEAGLGTGLPARGIAPEHPSVGVFTSRN